MRNLPKRNPFLPLSGKQNGRKEKEKKIFNFTFCVRETEKERKRADRSKSGHGFLFLFRGQTRERAKVNSSAAMYTANYREFDPRISNHGRSWLNWND